MIKYHRKIENLSALEQSIKYKFKELYYLGEALTHSSYSNESKNKSLRDNERIEFLGDSVLNLVISDYLFNGYRDLSEGELTKLRANIVCENSLSRVANNIDLGKYLFLGRGEELGGGRQRPSVLADALEALIGAIYLDGGLEVAKEFIIKQFKDIVQLSLTGDINRDYKTIFQEMVQSVTDQKIMYKVVNENGPDHDKSFEIEIAVGETTIAKGTGKSKKEAEQQAAKLALERYEHKNGNKR